MEGRFKPERKQAKRHAKNGEGGISRLGKKKKKIPLLSLGKSRHGPRSSHTSRRPSDEIRK